MVWFYDRNKPANKEKDFVAAVMKTAGTFPLSLDS